MITELTEKEIEEIEAKAYDYYKKMVATVVLGRNINGQPTDLSPDDIEELQHQTQLYFERKKAEALKAKAKYVGTAAASEYLKSLGEIKPAPNMTKEQYFQLAMKSLNNQCIAKTGKPYRLTDETSWVLEMLSCYFANDTDFYFYTNQTTADGKRLLVVDGDCDLNKGLAFFGPNGVGKSITLKAFAINARLSYACTNAKHFPEAYQADGFEGIGRYYSYMIGSTQKHYGQRQIGLFVDEVYGEVIGTNYGGVCETVESVLYERWERLPGYYTHINTNHKRSELEARYGSRFKSRLNGNMNLLKFPSNTPDFRTI